MNGNKVIIRVRFTEDPPPQPPANVIALPLPAKFVATLTVVSRVAGSGAVRKIA